MPKTRPGTFRFGNVLGVFASPIRSPAKRPDHPKARLVEVKRGWRRRCEHVKIVDEDDIVREVEGESFKLF
jgi:hypothetical protein